jgi:hypothetical protein
MIIVSDTIPNRFRIHDISPSQCLEEDEADDSDYEILCHDLMN